jgi:hypothetical protein
VTTSLDPIRTQHTQLPAEVALYADDPLSLQVTVDLASLGVPANWEFDTVLSADDSTITLLLFPIDDNEQLESIELELMLNDDDETNS